MIYLVYLLFQFILISNIAFILISNIVLLIRVLSPIMVLFIFIFGKVSAIHGFFQINEVNYCKSVSYIKNECK